MNTATQFLSSDADDDMPMPPAWQGDIDARDVNFFAAVGELMHTQPDLALVVCRKAFRQAETRGDNDAAVAALLRLYGVTRSTPMTFSMHSDVWALILDQAHALVDPVVRVRLSIIEMVRLLDEGENAEVLVKGNLALAQAMAVGNEHVLMTVLIPLQLALRQIGELGLALDVQQQMELLLRGGEPNATALHAIRSNNAAMVWLDLARRESTMGDASAVRVALQNALEQAELSCTLASTMPNDMFKVTHVDTMVQVLLKLGDPAAARALLERFQSSLAELPSAGTEIWGLLQLAQAHIDIHEERDPQYILRALQAVECIQCSDFQIGAAHRVIQTALAQVHERLGQHEKALACHKRLTDWQSQANAAMTRERVKLIRHSLLAMRTEAAEFITHDLRTPLAAARTWLHTVADDRLPASSQTALREAELQVRHAFDLSELYLSVLRAEFLPASALQRLDLGALTDDLCESLSPPTTSCIGLTRDAEIGVDVIGNARLLIRALTALLNHAFARTPTGTAVHVRVARAQGGAAGEVQVSVADQGDILSLQSRMRLYQCHAPGTAQGVSPLGLVARVARLHQARIRIDSKPAGGSTVTLRFKPADDFSFRSRTQP
jgi:signal transduction histidine kinase